MIYSLISHELLLTSELETSLLHVPANSQSQELGISWDMLLEAPFKKQHNTIMLRAVQMSKGGTHCPTELIFPMSDKADQVDPAGNFKQGNTNFGVIYIFWISEYCNL